MESAAKFAPKDPYGHRISMGVPRRVRRDATVATESSPAAGMLVGSVSEDASNLRRNETGRDDGKGGFDGDEYGDPSRWRVSTCQ